MASDSDLKRYREKRSFERTPEPADAGDIRTTGTLFVIQKHGARRLHYDLRLESDGVLKSWAVPKGPSLDPRDKRMAVRTEDHPLSYIDFEGVIPKGEYGGGAVEVWDRGTFVNLKPRQPGVNSITDSVERGHVLFWLQGEKLRGGFALQRIKEGKDEAWLLVKMRDAEVRPGFDPTRELPRSVLTQRDLGEISSNQAYISQEPPNVKVDLNGRRVALSNLDKILYPEAAWTKADVINYYLAISTYILPHVGHRPLTLKRYPDGVEGEHFYEKKCPSHRPAWITTADAGRTKVVSYCSVTDRASLVWVANLASLELHTLLSRSEDVLTPTMIAFDLDPGEGQDILNCAKVARDLRGILFRLGLECFAKTSGGKGLHVYIPLHTPVTFDQTKEFAHAVALMMQRFYPDEVVSNMSKQLRRGKVFMDWSQNDDHKTTVSAYSLRAQPRPTVSTPVTWKEIDDALDANDPRRLYFEAPQVLERVERMGDVFLPVAQMEQQLPLIESVQD
ncbi:MAG: non-homologous end-joining DNA ligase [Candidatus Geothermincolia bacterium]